MKAWMKTLLFYLGALAGMVVIGIGLGMWMGMRQAEASRARENAKAQAYLVENMRGIEAGRMFPDIPVWSVDGTNAFSVHELLPHGGLLIYVSSACDMCVGALEALSSAQAGAGRRAPAALVVLNGDPDSLTVRLRSRGLTMPFFRDISQSFERDYHVGVFPTTFVIADGGVLSAVVAGTYSRADFEAVLRR